MRISKTLEKLYVFLKQRNTHLAKRASKTKFKKALKQVADVEPDERDK